MSTEDSERYELLSLDYKTGFDTWRQLVDIRFKLLALIPVATLLGTSFQLPAVVYGAGFIFIIGLVFYEIRNTQIHDALGKRLIAIERALGESLAEGDPATPATFSARPGSSMRFLGIFRIWHNRSLAIVYATSSAAWLWRLAESIPILRAHTGVALLPSIGAGIVVYLEIVRLAERGSR